MKTFEDFILDCPLEESSLSRIKSKHDKGGVAIVSASRADMTRKEKSAAAKKLDRKIRSTFGKGATKAQGRWTEKDDKTGKETKVKERSHIITSGKLGKRKFKKKVKSVAKGQDAVITQTKGGGDATLKRTRKGGLPKKNIKLGKMRPQRTSPDGDTKIKGKTFTYDTK